MVFHKAAIGTITHRWNTTATTTAATVIGGAHTNSGRRWANWCRSPYTRARVRG